MDEDSELMTWHDSYGTGVAEIDEQHHILVNTLNEANEKLSETSSLEQVEQITRDLLSYALYHFEMEEGLMAEYGYDRERPEDYERHIHEHRKFSNTVVSVRDGLKLGKRVASADLLAFLKDWLVNHILNTDKRLGAFITEKQGR